MFQFFIMAKLASKIYILGFIRKILKAAKWFEETVSKEVVRFIQTTKIELS